MNMINLRRVADFCFDDANLALIGRFLFGLLGLLGFVVNLVFLAFTREFHSETAYAPFLETLFFVLSMAGLSMPSSVTWTKPYSRGILLASVCLGIAAAGFSFLWLEWIFNSPRTIPFYLFEMLSVAGSICWLWVARAEQKFHITVQSHFRQ